MYKQYNKQHVACQEGNIIYEKRLELKSFNNKFLRFWKNKVNDICTSGNLKFVHEKKKMLRINII